LRFTVLPILSLWFLFAGGEHITSYSYDGAGRQTVVVHPDGTETHYEYDGLERQILVIENATADESQPGEQRRRTAYFYECADAIPEQRCQGERLLKIAAVLPEHAGGVDKFSDIQWSAADGTLQVTEFVYGAEVVDQGGAGISRHNGWIAEVHYPDPATGQPIAAPSFAFTYYADGAVASRTDAKGNRFDYRYDELGRLVEVGFLSKSAYATGDDTTGTVAFEYSPDGKPTLATVYDDQAQILYQNQFDYDDRGNLVAEWQSHTGAVGGSTPFVGYEWEYSPADETHGNFDRLLSLTYPARPEATGPRELTFHYGSAPDAIDGQLNRITAIDDSELGTGLATYSHMGGGSRRVIAGFGNGVQAAETEQGDYAKAYDRFGRLRDLDYRDAVDEIIQRYRYGYDLAGNRTFARVTQSPATGTPNHDNDRSYLYSYDGLRRLVGADLGRLNNDNTAITPHPVVALAKQSVWELDNLGNWDLFERQTDLDGDGSYGEAGEGYQATVHEVDSANQITSHASFDALGVPLGEDLFVHDPAGNLVCDGTYVYQYDAWNQLVQVNERGDLEYDPDAPEDDDFDDAGRIAPNSANNPVHAIGTLVAQYAYDALGRLIVAYEATDLGTPAYQTVRFYYDGVRRIQEVVQGQGEDPDVTRAEYVYGPDYVDEFIVQTYNDGLGNQQPLFMLQDGNYNVVALLGQSGQVLEQYVWDPYGTPVVKHTSATPAPVNRVGHQGLFWHSLDGSATLNTPDPAANPTATGLYYNRNRWYAPHLGRFLQRDPNASASVLVSTLAIHGRATQILAESFSVASHFADGLNVYAYCSNDPVLARDPSGRFSAAAALAPVLQAAYAHPAITATVVTGVAALTGYEIYEMLQASGGIGAMGMGSVDTFDMFLDGVSAFQERSYSFGESMMSTAELTTNTAFAISQGAAIRLARSLWPLINEHWMKLATGGPNKDPNRGWARELKAWIDKIEQLSRRMKGKTAKQFADWARDSIETCVN